MLSISSRLRISFRQIIIFVVILLSLYTLVYALTIPGAAFNSNRDFDNLSRTHTLRLNLTSGLNNITNVSFYAVNSTAFWFLIGVNSSVNLSQYTMTFDTTGVNFSDNINYMLVANISNISSNASNPGILNVIEANVSNITIDNTPPTVTFAGSGGNTNPDTADNATFFNSTIVLTFNFTVIDGTFRHMTGPCNVTLDPTNSTFGGSLNGSSEFANNTNFALTAILALEGTHNYRVQCTDNIDTNNTGNSTIRTIGLDRTPPMINISFHDQVGAEQTQFGPNADVTVRCLRADRFAGVNSTEILLRNPVEQTLNSKRLDQTATDASTSLSATEFIIPSAETENLGSYLVACRAIDRAGNLYSVNKTFDVVTQPPRSTSAFAIPGFTAPVGKVKINSGITSDGGKLGPDGISRLMQAGASLKFDIKGQDHIITVVTVADESVTLKISSEPLTLTVKKGETTDVDIDRDGTNDLAVTYHKRFPPGGKHADLTFALTETPAVETAPDTGQETPEERDIFGLPEGSMSGLIVTLVVVVAILVIGYFVLTQRKR